MKTKFTRRDDGVVVVEYDDRTGKRIAREFTRLHDGLVKEFDELVGWVLAYKGLRRSGQALYNLSYEPLLTAVRRELRTLRRLEKAHGQQAVL